MLETFCKIYISSDSPLIFFYLFLISQFSLLFQTIRFNQGNLHSYLKLLSSPFDLIYYKGQRLKAKQGPNSPCTLFSEFE